MNDLKKTLRKVTNESKHRRKKERRITMKNVTYLLSSLLAVTVMVLGLSASAFAEANDADAGDTIGNRATLNYFVGTVDQPDIESSPSGNSTSGTGNGADTEFVVDHKVRPLVANITGNTVIPGASNQTLRFTVTNDGNTDSDAPEVLQLKLFTEIDASSDFNPTSIRIFRDNGATAGTFEIGSDTDITSDPVIELARDTSETIWVVANIPATATNTQTATIDLRAQAWTGWVSGGAAGSALAEGAANVVTSSEVVWADDSGTSSVDTGGVDLLPANPPDGIHSAAGVYTVGSVVLSVKKESSIVYDPVGGGYHIPGAIVRYVITVTNDATASTSALLTNIIDDLDANLALVELSDGAGGVLSVGNEIKVDFTSTATTGRASQSASQYFDQAAGSNTYTGNPGGVLTVDFATVLPAEGTAPDTYAAGELKPNESVTIEFHVEIQ